MSGTDVLMQNNPPREWAPGVWTVAGQGNTLVVSLGDSLLVVDAGPGKEITARMIAVARAHGMKVMLGCMIESSLAIAAAAHISPLVDTADLDGHLLIDNDPFVGPLVRDGRLILPEGPGLGVRPRG